MTERVLAPAALVHAEEGRAVALPEAAAHHLRVVRVAFGDRVVLFDGAGVERDATVERAGRDGVAVTPRGAPRPGVTADRARVTWLQGYPKGDKLDTIVRQATELGVAELRPVYTARSVPREREDRVAARVERWRRIAEEAARQSGRADVPAVHPPAPLDEALALASGAALRVVAWEGATRPLAEAARGAGDGAVAALAGPEGGLEASEVERCEARGFAAVSLGPRVLRAETVAPALLAALSVLRGDLSR